MSLELDLQLASALKDHPDPKIIESWIVAVLEQCHLSDAHSVTLRIVDEPEMQELNKNYRKKDKPTNVLAFPNMLPQDLNQDLDENYLGDIILCAPVVAKEAQEQNKALNAHWAHMIVHSTLHLLGYDHQEETQASHMEDTERAILEKLGFPNPYLPIT